jgi:hypothetical protein
MVEPQAKTPAAGRGFVFPNERVQAEIFASSSIGSRST